MFTLACLNGGERRRHDRPIEGHGFASRRNVEHWQVRAGQKPPIAALLKQLGIENRQHRGNHVRSIDFPIDPCRFSRNDPRSALDA
jgi:hypothetical protein